MLRSPTSTFGASPVSAGSASATGVGAGWVEREKNAMWSVPFAYVKTLSPAREKGKALFPSPLIPNTFFIRLLAGVCPILLCTQRNHRVDAGCAARRNHAGERSGRDQDRRTDSAWIPRTAREIVEEWRQVGSYGSAGESERRAAKDSVETFGKVPGDGLSLFSCEQNGPAGGQRRPRRQATLTGATS